MGTRREHNIQLMHIHDVDFDCWRERYFWLPFFRKRKPKFNVRPGAMVPEVVKQRIKSIGIGKLVEIIRVGYDGEIDDIPIIVEIIDISESSFTGKIVNVEREVIESATEKLVYAKKGGGILEFNYDDGDIKEIIESQDEKLLAEERNVNALREILSALEIGDRIMVAYYDTKQHGTLNAEGILLEKDINGNTFSLQVEKVNKIELEKKFKKTFDIKKDLVIDIEIV